MRRHTVLFGFVLLAFVCVATTLPGAFGKKVPDQSKLEALRKLMAKQGPNQLPVLNDEEYVRFALNGPRPYDIVVVFTVRDTKFQCSACVKAEKEAIVLANSYARAVPDPEDRELFFAAADYNTAPRAFSVHQFQSAPNFVWRERTDETSSPMGAVPLNDKQVLRVPSMQDASQVPVPEDVLAFIGMSHIRVVRDPIEVIPTAFLVVLIVTVLAILGVHNPSALAFPVRKTFWMFGCMTVYVVSISGIVYCIIRTPPMYGTDRAGKPSIFDPSGSGQYVLEGLLVGALNLFAGLGIIFAIRIAKSRTPSHAAMVFGVLCGLATYLVLYLSIVEVYQSRTPWYSVSKLIPSQFNVRAGKRWLRSLLRTATAQYNDLLGPHQ